MLPWFSTRNPLEVAVWLTGNGLKATEPLMSILPVPKAINADDEKILAVIK